MVDKLEFHFSRRGVHHPIAKDVLIQLLGIFWWKEFGEKQIEHFLSLAGREYIKRISILGGEPLCQQNVNDITALVKV